MPGILSTITGEPFHLMAAIAMGVKYGAGIQDALLFDKVCLYELGYSEEICANLTLYEDEEIQVQEMVNTFNLGRSMAQTIISIITALFVGGFTDRFGFKITLTVYFIGVFLSEGVDWIFYLFLENIPLYFLYVELLFHASKSGFYLALYGLINRFVSKDKLAVRIGFMDGVYTIGWMIGVIPSALLFRALGYIGVYATTDILYIMAFLYHLIFVHEYPKGQENKAQEEKPKEKSGSAFKQIQNMIKAGTVDVIKDLFHTLAKPRPHHMRPLIILALIAMPCYNTSFLDYTLTYAYMYLMFGVTPEQFSLFSITTSVVSLVCLFALMPIMRDVLKLHESIIITLVLMAGAGLMVWSALVQELIPFIVIVSLANLKYVCYPNGRTLLTKMIDDDEVPKMYGFLNLINNIASLVGIPLYRGLYNATLETFPGAFLMLSAGLLTFPALIYFVFITQRGKIEMLHRRKKEAKESEESEMSKTETMEGSPSQDDKIETHL